MNTWAKNGPKIKTSSDLLNNLQRKYFEGTK